MKHVNVVALKAHFNYFAHGLFYNGFDIQDNKVK